MSAGLYHLNTKGNNGRALYLDDHDREAFLAMVGRVVRRHAWICHAFCLMTNHYHLLVNTPDESLPKGMQRLNQGYRSHSTVVTERRDMSFRRRTTRNLSPGIATLSSACAISHTIPW
jgi:putative transposase